MKRVALRALGSLVGFAVFLAIPYINGNASAQEAAIADSRSIVASGKFLTVDPSDPLHWGRGSITITRDRIQLSDDFETAVGPNLHLYLVSRDSVTESEHVIESDFVDIGSLPSRKGAASFKLPDNIDLKKYAYAVIWCDDFKSLFSPAKLEFLN